MVRLRTRDFGVPSRDNEISTPFKELPYSVDSLVNSMSRGSKGAPQDVSKHEGFIDCESDESNGNSDIFISQKKVATDNPNGDENIEPSLKMLFKCKFPSP
jgi:hypothetical protein